MLRRGVCLAACLVGASLIATSVGSSAQERKGTGRRGAGGQTCATTRDGSSGGAGPDGSSSRTARDGSPCATSSNGAAGRTGIPSRSSTTASGHDAASGATFRRAAARGTAFCSASTRDPSGTATAPSHGHAFRASHRGAVTTRHIACIRGAAVATGTDPDARASARSAHPAATANRAAAAARGAVTPKRGSPDPHRSAATARAAIAVSEAGRRAGPTCTAATAADTEPPAPAGAEHAAA